MSATNQQKVLMAGTAVIISEPVLALMHGGPLGIILGLGAGYGGYLFADEIEAGMSKVHAYMEERRGRQPSSSSSAEKKEHLAYRILNGKSGRLPLIEQDNHTPQNSNPVTEEIEIDPEILSMLQNGSFESAVLLLERARLANVEEETGVPSFRKLLEDGVIQRAAKKGQMILGYVDGVARYGSWLDLYSCGVGGVSGTGKTTTVRFLLYQMIMGGGHLIMIDPHIGDEEESLAAEFRAFTQNVHLYPPCNDDEKEVLKRVKFLHAEYLARKKGLKGPPILFVLDEYNALVRSLSETTVKALADLLLAIAQEGRKFGLFAMIIAQRWSENDLGGKNYGAAIRSSLSSRICHRFTDEDQAKRFIGSKYGVKSLELQKGHHFYRDTEGGIKETVTPYTVQADGEVIRGLLFPASLTSRSTSEVLPAASQTQPEALEEVDYEADTEVLEDDLEMPVSEDFKTARVREMLRAKASQNEIISTIWQTSGGKKYQDATIELREIISSLI
jgi:hypothetical protein